MRCYSKQRKLKCKKRKHSPCECQTLKLPFITLTFLLLAFTSHGTWGVAQFFWPSEWFHSPFCPPPPLHLPCLFSQFCLQCFQSFFCTETCPTSERNFYMEFCQAEVKQQKNSPMLKNSVCSDTWGGTRQKWVSLQCWCLDKKEPPLKDLTPAAKHVQQRWNVYSQAYTKNARGSIVTQSRGHVFEAFASFLRQYAENRKIKQH